MKDGYRTDLPYDKKYVMAREMYDYEKDPLEKVSIIDKAEYAQDQKKLESLFLESMNREHKSSVEYTKLADFKPAIPVGSEAKKAQNSKAKKSRKK